MKTMLDSKMVAVNARNTTSGRMPVWTRLLFKLIVLGGLAAQATAQTPVPLKPGTLVKYSDSLPIPGVMPASPISPDGTYYEVGIWQKQQKLHAQLPPTTVWCYGPD